MVKSNLYSRSRQQSEPPVHRNMFPPTPPPENDPIRPAFMTPSTSPPSNSLPLSRASILTNTPPSKPLRPEPLNLEAITQEKPRIGTTRTASEPRGPSFRRPHNHRERDHSARPRLFGETTPHRPHSNGDDADLEEYPAELYSMDPRTTRQHNSPRKSRSSRHYSDTGSQRQRRSGRSKSRQRREHYSIDEEPSEDPGTASTTSSLDEYEILHNAGGGLSRPRDQSNSRRGASRSRQYVYRLKDVRVKVHYGDDARFIMLTPDVAFASFVGKVREKLHLKGDFKCKIQDEGDLITMGDGDDWDMAMSSVRKEARAEGVEMGKMEVWIIDVAWWEAILMNMIMVDMARRFRITVGTSCVWALSSLEHIHLSIYTTIIGIFQNLSALTSMVSEHPSVKNLWSFAIHLEPFHRHSSSNSREMVVAASCSANENDWSAHSHVPDRNSSVCLLRRNEQPFPRRPACRWSDREIWTGRCRRRLLL